MSTHYSYALEPSKLNVWAHAAAKLLYAAYMKGRNNYKSRLVLCYTGLSGISHATALALVFSTDYPKVNINCVYIRKGSEDSHGRNIEQTKWYNLQDYFVFVDDFIDSGKTIKRVKLRLAQDLNETNFVFDNACFIKGMMDKLEVKQVKSCFYDTSVVVIA